MHRNSIKAGWLLRNVLGNNVKSPASIFLEIVTIESDLSPSKIIFGKRDSSVSSRRSPQKYIDSAFGTMERNRLRFGTSADVIPTDNVKSETAGNEVFETIFCTMINTWFSTTR